MNIKIENDYINYWVNSDYIDYWVEDAEKIEIDSVDDFIVIGKEKDNVQHRN